MLWDKHGGAKHARQEALPSDRKENRREENAMKNVLLIGMGRFGKYAAQKLNSLGHDVMAVDKREDRIEKNMDYVASGRIGDAADKSFLMTLGVTDYDLCIVAIGDCFLESLEITSLLKELGAKRVVSRAASMTQEKFLLRNGADSVVFPERELANWTAIRYTSDHIDNYIEVSDGYAIFEVRTPAEWDNKRIGEIDVRKRYGVNILGTRNGKMMMNPSVDTVLHKEETMLVLGKYEDLHKLFRT